MKTTKITNGNSPHFTRQNPSSSAAVSLHWNVLSLGPGTLWARLEQGRVPLPLAQEGKTRQRRTARNKNANRNRKALAAHYEVKSRNDSPQAQADHNGIIKDWIEVKLNSTNPLSYNSINGEFKVNKRGLYYLYCQVHFNEGKSIYMKLDIALDGAVAFRCLEEFSTTAASIQEAEVKVCQVSGLVLLQPNSAILIKTIKDVSLKTERYLTYFGLFQVH